LAAAQEVDYTAQARAVRARSEAKERVVRALLAGEGTLLEAAARFRQLDAAEPRVRPESHPTVYAGDTEAERYCRAVIVWAASYARSRASEVERAAAAAAVRRLGEELEGHQVCGTLTLPAPRPSVHLKALAVE
jgi:hypothetical protein